MPDDPTDLPPAELEPVKAQARLSVTEAMARDQALRELSHLVRAYNEVLSKKPFPFADYVKTAADLAQAAHLKMPADVRLTPSREEMTTTLLKNIAEALNKERDGQQVLKTLLGSDSPYGQAYPGRVPRLCELVTNQGGPNSAAAWETNRFLAEPAQKTQLRQVIMGIEAKAPCDAEMVAKASILALEAGALSAHGEFVGEMCRLTGKRRAGDDRGFVPDEGTQEWLKRVLESEAYANAAKVYPRPEVLDDMKMMIFLCKDEAVKGPAVEKFDEIAKELKLSGALSEAQLHKTARLQTEVVGLRVTQALDPVKQLQAAEQALQNGSKDLVDTHVRDLLQTGDHDAIDLAGQIVLSDEFKKAFGTTATAEALVNVAEAQLVQPKAFAEGQIPTDRLLQAGKDLLPEKLEDVKPSTDVKPALRVADLLAKRGTPAFPATMEPALNLLNQVKDTQIKVYNLTPPLTRASPQRDTTEIDPFILDDLDEPQDEPKLSQAEELQTMAHISRAYSTYFRDLAPPLAKELSDAAGHQLQQALDTGNWNEVAGLGEVADQLKTVSETLPGLKGLITRREMIDKALTKAETLWKEVNDPKNNLNLADPANHEFMDALECGFALASHDRHLCKIPLQKAKDLQKEVMLKQTELLTNLNEQVKKVVPDGEPLDTLVRNEQAQQLQGLKLTPQQEERENLRIELSMRLGAAPDNVRKSEVVQKAEITYNTLRDLGRELDDAVNEAVETSHELDEIGKHSFEDRTPAQLRQDVHRFQGELKTGLPYARAFTYSSGGNMSEDDKAIVSDFAKQASFAVSQATMELMGNDLGRWDLSSKNMENHINRQANWEKSENLLKEGGWPGKDTELLTARKALTNDMRLLAKYSEKNPTKNELKDLHRTELAKLLKDNRGNLNDAIKQRAQEIKANPKHERVLKSASSLMGTFAKAAGYLVEERAYQLMQDPKRSGWDAQNTTVIPADKKTGKQTRPDVMQRLGGNQWAALDFTASKSSGHIFDKANAWKASNVTQVVEITYPSFKPEELERFMLEKAAIDPEAVARAKQEAALHQERVERTKIDARDDVRTLYQELRKSYGSVEKLEAALKNEAGSDLLTLSRWADMRSSTYGLRRWKDEKKMNISSRTTPEQLDTLTASVRGLHKLAGERGVKIPPKVEQMAKHGIGAYREPLPNTSVGLSIKRPSPSSGQQKDPKKRAVPSVDNSSKPTGVSVKTGTKTF